MEPTGLFNKLVFRIEPSRVKQVVWFEGHPEVIAVRFLCGRMPPAAVSWQLPVQRLKTWKLDIVALCPFQTSAELRNRFRDNQSSVNQRIVGFCIKSVVWHQKRAEPIKCERFNHVLHRMFTPTLPWLLSAEADLRDLKCLPQDPSGPFYKNLRTLLEY